MTPFYKKILLILLLMIGVVGVIKTNHLQRLSGTGDLRNRVVGARFMKDGILPYHYPCKAAAPLTISVSSVVIAAWRARL